MNLTVFLAIAVILVCITISSAEATTVLKGPKLYADQPIRGNHGNFITIELSKTCLVMAKANLTSNCPTYKDLEVFDTTNQKISGKFFQDGDFYHRGKPMYKNYQLSYPKAVYPWVICVDCSQQIIIQSKNIIVEAGSFVYKKGSDSHIVNNTRYEYSQRYVDSCTIAHIAYSDFLLNDTINYLESGCTKTDFKEKTVVVTPYVKHDIKTSQAYKNQKWLEEAKKLKGINCLKSDLC